jgi:hypothetical protein
MFLTLHNQHLSDLTEEYQAIMSEPAYYKLAGVEALLRCSRDTINRLERTGLLKVDGTTSRQRRANGASVRRLLTRIEKGESLWDLLQAARAAQSAAGPTARARCTTTTTAASGAISRRRSRRSASHGNTSATATPASTPPSWLKRIG